MAAYRINCYQTCESETNVTCEKEKDVDFQRAANCKYKCTESKCQKRFLSRSVKVTPLICGDFRGFSAKKEFVFSPAKNKMFLTIVNYFKRTVPGHIFRGKRRLVRKVSLKAVARAVKEYERQEQVMLLLRHPYLTLAESEGHTKELKKHDAFIEKWRTAKTMNKMKPHITIEQRLSCLKVKESWD